MSEIQVNTSDLHTGSQNLNGAAGEIGGAQSQVSSAPSRVGNAYDGQLRQAIEGIVGGAAQTGARLQNRAHELGNELFSRATAFEAANEVGRSAVLGASTAYVDFIQTTPSLGIFSFLRNKFKEMGASIWNMGGLAIGGFLSLLFVNAKPGIITPFPESGTFTQSTQASQNSDPSSEKTGFGILLEKYEQEKKGGGTEATKSAQPTEPESPASKYDIYYDVSAKSQGTLYGSAACLPTSMSMVMDYYHNNNADNKTATPDDLIKMLDPGDGSNTGKTPGIRLDKLNDDLGELGYQSDTKPGNMDDLTSNLKEGPVIVNVEVKLVSQPARDIVQGGNTNHAILVKAINADSVVINDPWSGFEKTLSRETFEKMWSKGENYMVIVRPQK